MAHLQYTFDLIMTGNGFKQISIPSGMGFVSIINNTDNTIEMYQDSVTASGDGKLLLKVPMYTALTIPVNQRTDFSFVYTNGGANTTKTVQVIFSEESLGINTPLGSNASLGNVTITGDNINLAKGAQLPSTLSGTGNLKVDVQNYPATQTIAGTVGVSNFPATQTVTGTVSANTTPTGWTWQKVTAASAGDITVKASAGKVAKFLADAAEKITLKDGTNPAWKMGGSFDGYGCPLQCTTSIVLNFDGAGAAWILFQ